MPLIQIGEPGDWPKLMCWHFLMLRGNWLSQDQKIILSCSSVNPNNLLLKYADDVVVFCPNRHLLTEEHGNIISWSSDNQLLLNIKKCQHMSFGQSRGSPIFIKGITTSSCVKYLGVWLSSDLKWSQHIFFVIKKASQSLYLLYLLKPISSKYELVCAYNADTRSLIEYTGPLIVTLPQNLAAKYNKIQPRAHRIICGFDCDNFCLPSLVNRRINYSIKLFNKALEDSSHILHDITPPYGHTGNRSVLFQCKSQRHLNSFIPACTIIFNNCLWFRPHPDVQIVNTFYFNIHVF